MKCEFIYCIYNEELKCNKSEVKINSSGMCNESIAVNIPEGIIQFYKKNQIIELEEKHNRLLIENEIDSEIVYFEKFEKIDSSLRLD